MTPEEFQQLLTQLEAAFQQIEEILSRNVKLYADLMEKERQIKEGLQTIGKDEEE